MNINRVSGKGDKPFSGRIEEKDKEDVALAKAVLGQTSGSAKFQASKGGLHPKTQQIAEIIFGKSS